jgi:hypothetical protein
LQGTRQLGSDVPIPYQHYPGIGRKEGLKKRKTKGKENKREGKERKGGEERTEGAKEGAKEGRSKGNEGSGGRKEVKLLPMEFPLLFFAIYISVPTFLTL